MTDVRRCAVKKTSFRDLFMFERLITITSHGLIEHSIRNIDKFASIWFDYKVTDFSLRFERNKVPNEAKYLS